MRILRPSTIGHITFPSRDGTESLVRVRHAEACCRLGSSACLLRFCCLPHHFLPGFGVRSIQLGFFFVLLLSALVYAVHL